MEFEQIGKYKILSEIGQGAMGVVYKAHDPILNRYVAIKTISATLGADDDLRKRFHREAQAAARLNHPNIITVFDFGEEHGKIYMAMELLEGTDLKDVMAGGQLATLDDKLAIMEQILDGLAFAHAKEIVHRDLKPGNIHIQPNGQIKIMDFGLARLGSSEMTQAGVVMGTPNYMSPEQVLGEKVDSRSDIFAMGAVFYELLTTHKPFEAESMHGVLFQVVHKDPQAIRKWAPDLPPVLVQVVEKCLVKDKTKRFQNAGELREAVMEARQALLHGRISEATLDMESGKVFFDADQLVDEGDATDPGMQRPASWPPQKRDGQWVEGTVALDQAPLEDVLEQPSAASKQPTLSGRNKTQVNRQRTQRGVPAPPPPSRMPVYIGAAVVVLAVAGGVGYWMSTRPILDPTFNLLLESELRNVRRDMDNKAYKETIDGATKIIDLAALDPRKAANPLAQRTLTEVREVLSGARSSLNRIEDAARGAEEAMSKGDLETAGTKLSELIQLEPKHQVAAKLLPQLNVQFKTKAEEAKQTAQQARRDAAELEGAEAQADFGKAQGMSREAEAALGKGEFALATRGFLEARDTFDKVRRGLEGKLEEKLKSDRALAQKAAEDSKRQMATAKGAVEKLEGAAAAPEYQRAEKLARDAAALEAKNDFAAATRAYMDARDYFGRAKTTLDNKSALDRVIAQKAAEDSKRQMGIAKAGVERLEGAQSNSDFQKGENLAREGAAAESKTDFATAARTYTEAREAFGRAKAALEAKSVSTPPPTTPGMGTLPPPPPPVPGPVVGTLAGRGRTDLRSSEQDRSAEGKGRAPEVSGTLEFDIQPSSVSVGQPFVIKLLVNNSTGSKPWKVKSIEVKLRINRAEVPPMPIAMKATDVPPGEKVVVAEATGTWPDAVNQWVATATVTTDRGDLATNVVSFTKQK
jgi:serine/threonine-protein kinase